MHFLAAIVLFPLLLWLLSAGCGLLVERLSGARIPALLILPVGFGTLIVVSEFTTWWGPTAPLTPIVLAALAIGGLLAGRRSALHRWRERRRDWWLALAPAVAAYVIAAAA